MRKDGAGSFEGASLEARAERERVPLSRELKNDLGLRPVYHRLDDRIEAHIFAAFMALCLLATLRAIARARAPGLTPRQIIDKFKTLKMVDVILPTTDGRVLMVSTPTMPILLLPENVPGNRNPCNGCPLASGNRRTSRRHASRSNRKSFGIPFRGNRDNRSDRLHADRSESVP